jgi:hypothetical protein
MLWPHPDGVADTLAGHDTGSVASRLTGKAGDLRVRLAIWFAPVWVDDCQHKALLTLVNKNHSQQ